MAELKDSYQYCFPLLCKFKFVHEPITENHADWFVGREAELDEFVERILYSEGGSFLLTGYRGVGKTSFVNQAIRLLKEKAKTRDGTDVVVVRLNLARAVKPAELMHHIIRALREELLSVNILTGLKEELRNEIHLAHLRTSVNMTQKASETMEKSFGFKEASLGGEFLKAALKVSTEYKRSHTHNNEITFLGYDDRAAEYDIIKIARKLTDGFVRKPRLLTRIKRLLRRAPEDKVKLKIVFVFDELDKLSEFASEESAAGATKNGRVTDDAARSQDALTTTRATAIDDILNSLKNIFTTSGLTFIFVAGKDLHERWQDELGRGDSVYESVFSYDVYISCIWTDSDKICNNLIDWRALPEEGIIKRHAQYESAIDSVPESGRENTEASVICIKCGDNGYRDNGCNNCRRPVDFEQAGKALADFKKYLSYKGRGIPRRIVRGFNDHVKWYRDRPFLVFTETELRHKQFYAELQDLFLKEEEQLFGNSSRWTSPAEKDKQKLSLYYIIDWLLHRGSLQFTFKDIYSASKRLSVKIAPVEEIAPNLLRNILDILCRYEYIEEVSRRLNQTMLSQSEVSEQRFRLTDKTLAAISDSNDVFKEEVKLFTTTTPASSSTEAGAIIGNRYQLHQLLGQGGFSKIYKAIDLKNGNDVVIKSFINTADSIAVGKIIEKVRISLGFRHPNLVSVQDIIHQNDQWHVVESFIDGIDLNKLLQQQTRLDYRAAASITICVAQGAGYIHDQGYCRLDIKPGNILISKNGKVYLTDYDIMKSISETGEEVLMGTPIFFAPEQMRGDTDPRSDIYSLGVCFYQMLTGELPFELQSASTLFEISIRRVNARLKPISELLSPFPQMEGIERVVSKCLSFEPQERYQSMKELISDLMPAADLPESDLTNEILKITTDLSFGQIER